MHLGTRSSLYIPRATGVKPNLVLSASCGCGQDGLKRAVSYVSVWMCYRRMLTGGDIKYESEGNDKRCESTMTIMKEKKRRSTKQQLMEAKERWERQLLGN